MKNLFFVLALVSTLFVQAQSILDDEPDIDDYLERFSSGIVTESMVNDLKTRAIAAFDEQNCDAGIPLLEEWATQSNALANLYSQTLRPFYRSTHSEREDEYFTIRKIEDLVENESKSNSLIFDRNTAWIYLGECYALQGEDVLAISYFSQALDLLSVKTIEIDNWNRAAKGIMNIINK